jgi:AcrR family transcriptional regulator
MLIVEAAYTRLRNHGLAGLSMRRLASDLGVQPGALYYYVASKQELLAGVAERILGDVARGTTNIDPAQAARDIRDVLLLVRDSAEVVSFVHAFRPDVLTPLETLQEAFAASMLPVHARRAAQTLISFVLGFVAEEQNYAELTHAGIPSRQAPDAYSFEAFRFGVDVILRGLASESSPGSRAERRH